MKPIDLLSQCLMLVGACAALIATLVIFPGLFLMTAWDADRELFWKLAWWLGGLYSIAVLGATAICIVVDRRPK